MMVGGGTAIRHGRVPEPSRALAGESACPTRLPGGTAPPDGRVPGPSRPLAGESACPTRLPGDHDHWGPE
jgi:hypothetical protein